VAQEYFQQLLKHPDSVNLEIQAIQRSPDGTILMGGTVKDELGVKNLFAARFSALGAPLWQKIFYDLNRYIMIDQVNDTLIEQNVSLQSIKITEDNSYVFCGSQDSVVTYQDSAGITSFFLSEHIWILKTDELGIPQYSTKFRCERDCFAARMVLDDSSFGKGLIAGSIRESSSNNRDLLLIDFSNNGNVNGAYTTGNIFNDEPYDLKTTDDGGYIACGESVNIFSDRNVWVLKLDKFILPQWAFTYGTNDPDLARSLIKVKGGGYLFAGTTGNSNPSMLIARIDSAGMLKRSLMIGSSQNDEPGQLVGAGSSAAYLLVDRSTSGTNPLIVKMDTSGSLIWSKEYVQGANGYNEQFLAAFGDANSLVAAGYANVSNSISGLIMKIDSAGNTDCEEMDVLYSQDSVLLSAVTYSQPIVPTSITESKMQLLVENFSMVFDTTCLTGTFLEEILNPQNEFQIYPNPAADVISIRNFSGEKVNAVEIIGSTGLLMRAQLFQHSNSEITIEAGSLPAGIYLLKLITSGGLVRVEKLVLQK
jgi:hypothetical protein